MISKEFLTRVKLSRLRSYQIAQLAGLHPSTLSKLVTGIEHPKNKDLRIIAVGRVLGLKPDECFEQVVVTAAGDTNGTGGA
jgi:hypothetical protein